MEPRAEVSDYQHACVSKVLRRDVHKLPDSEHDSSGSKGFIGRFETGEHRPFASVLHDGHTLRTSQEGAVKVTSGLS
jgi:hypothetical protein